MTGPGTAEVKQYGITRAVVTRADGTVEDLGVVDASYPDLFRRTWWRWCGKPLADRRIRRANANAARLRENQGA